MHPDLAKLAAEMTRTLSVLEQGQITLPPPKHPHKWTVQQHVEHLCLTYRSSIKALEARISKGRPSLARPMLRQQLMHFTIISCGFFPRGQSSPPAVSPGSLVLPSDGPALSSSYRQELDELDQAIDNAQRVFDGRPCATHLVLGPLSAEQWRRFHLVHGRHHLTQIRRLSGDLLGQAALPAATH
jgi:hypothetical protein